MFKPKVFILDVDGVMTSGNFLYTSEGKFCKSFDALSILNNYLEIRFVTGDKKGFEISNKRIVEDMGYKLDLVSTIKRIDWIKDRYSTKEVIYMGDIIFDHYYEGNNVLMHLQMLMIMQKDFLSI